MSRRADAAPARHPGADELLYPADLAAWSSWQASRRPLLLRLGKRSAAPSTTGVLTAGSSEARIITVIDGETASNEAALLAPLRFLDPSDVAVLAPHARRDVVGESSLVSTVSTPAELLDQLPALRGGLSAGAYLPLSTLAHEAINRCGGASLFVQHGVLTPHSPPLPRNAHLLCWSDADGEYWKCGRGDVSYETVGSQLLFQARPADPPVDARTRPIFLGQLHAAELKRTTLARTAIDFCLATGARYRPHPSEHDKLSQLWHKVMRRRGVRFDESDLPLPELNSPVVAIFSSGILEAAAAGIPSWGYHPDPPAWVEGFWHRYGIARWGLDPTPRPPSAEIEPARRIAQIITLAVEER